MTNPLNEFIKKNFPGLRYCSHIGKIGLNGSAMYYCKENRCVNTEKQNRCMYAYDENDPKSLITVENEPIKIHIKCWLREGEKDD
jgi:hypothetical protein